MICNIYMNMSTILYIMYTIKHEYMPQYETRHDFRQCCCIICVQWSPACKILACGPAQTLLAKNQRGCAIFCIYVICILYIDYIPPIQYTYSYKYRL